MFNENLNNSLIGNSPKSVGRYLRLAAKRQRTITSIICILVKVFFKILNKKLGKKGLDKILGWLVKIL
ncbi:hypothetical protein FPG59_15615 [Flavobacterium sp. FPG59]|nr:hypothetical protein FPG59_15615 [Flavobacterium sp. FPG59]